MDASVLITALALGTIAIVAVVAYINKTKAEAKIDHDKKSTLAADAPDQR